jgi:hypothetical protein
VTRERAEELRRRGWKEGGGLSAAQLRGARSGEATRGGMVCQGSPGTPPGIRTEAPREGTGQRFPRHTSTVYRTQKADGNGEIGMNGEVVKATKRERFADLPEAKNGAGGGNRTEGVR